MWSIVVVLVLWVLVAPIAAMVIARGTARRTDILSRRITDLEAQLATRLAEAGEQRRHEIAAPELGAANAAAVAAQDPLRLDAAEQASAAESLDAGAAPPLAAAPWGSMEGAEAPRPEPVHAATLAAPPPRGESLESRIGARWSVLVGGLALALGAVFLVRYSIEAGLLGPRARIALGFLLSILLFGAGEVLRRRDRADRAPVFAGADVPAVLTGAGGIAAFATIFAAYALYGFIGDAVAFVLLTAAGLATLFLSVVHGPALAALGALGSYVAPLLVSAAEPKPFPVALHTLAVTAAVLGIARLRGWRWLAAAGVAGGLLWGVLLSLITDVNTTAAEMLTVAGLAGIFTAALVAGTEPRTLRDRALDAYVHAAFAGLACLSLFYVWVNAIYPPLLSGIVLVGILGAIASRWASAAGAVVIAGGLAVLTTMIMPALVGAAGLGMMNLGPLQWNVLGDAGLAEFAQRSAAMALLIGLGSLLSADRAAGTAPRTAGLFAAAGAAAPLLILVVLYLRHVPFETRPAVGIASLALAGAFAASAERLIARRPGDFAAPASAFYATGAVLGLSFAMAVGLATQFIPLALSLGAAGVVWVALQRPVRVLPGLAVLLAALACVALLRNPPFDPAEIGTTPILNGLLIRLGLPAAAVLLAGETLRRRENSSAAAWLQAIGLALAALFVAAEIRHLVNDGRMDAGIPGLGEQSALTLAALGFSLGMQRIAARTQDRVYRDASLVAGIVGAGAIALAHFGTANPVLTGEPVGEGHFLNLLLPGYLLPAVVAAWVAAAARSVRPRWFILLFAALSLALGFAYITLTVRHSFHGARLDLGPIGDGENWTYSAVWLLFGIALLAGGIMFRSTAIRAASALVIAAVVCKVFLLDMSALTGALRAASFLGLGVVLILIGRIYQRLLGRPDPTAASTAPA